MCVRVHNHYACLKTARVTHMCLQEQRNTPGVCCNDLSSSNCRNNKDNTPPLGKRNRLFKGAICSCLASPASTMASVIHRPKCP